jgi:hypothetical protein
MRGAIPPLLHYFFMTWSLVKAQGQLYVLLLYIRGPFERFVTWPQCAAVMQRKAVTVNAKL